MKNKVFYLTILVALLLFSGSANARPLDAAHTAVAGGFTNASFQGEYALTGFVGANVAAIVGICHFDGSGHFNCHYTANFPGENATRAIIPITDKGEYTINADGTGTIHEFETVDGVTSEYNHDIVILDAEAIGSYVVATEIYGLVNQTDPSGSLFTSHYDRLPDMGMAPATTAASGVVQQLDQATMQQAHDELVGATGAYSVTERVVDFQNQGQKIVGTLTLPAGGDPPFPIVLFFQGLTSTRDELPVTGADEAMFTRAARMLAEQGIASLRIDYRGFGESEGTKEDMTFSGLIADSLAAIDYLATLPEVDLQRLGLIGLSTGGLIAAETAARDPRVQSVVLWSPLTNLPDHFKLQFGAEKIAAGLQSVGEPVHIVFPWGDEIDWKTPFFEDIYALDPVAAMSTVKRPLMVVVGLRDVDETPQPYYGQLYLNYHEGAELLVPVDSDHIFDTMSDKGPAVLDDVITWSLAWLQNTLPAGVTR